MIDQGLILQLCAQGKSILEEMNPILRHWQEHLIIESADLNTIFRGLHTIKGGFAFFSMHNVTSLTHAMEESLSEMRDMIVNLTQERADILCRAAVVLETLLDAQWAADDIDISEILTALGCDVTVDDQETAGNQPYAGKKQSDEWPIQATAQQHHKASRMQRSLYRLTLYPHADIEADGLTLLDMNDMLAAMGNLMRVSVGIQDIAGLDDCLDIKISYQVLFMSKVAIDDLQMTLDIPIEQIELLEPPHAEGAEGDEGADAEDTNSIASLLRTMAEMAQEVARHLGKDISTAITIDPCVSCTLGAGQRMDLQAALIHIVRNAIDHGIESGKQRILMAKPERGYLKFSSTCDDQQIYSIRIEDDGAGIDTVAVLARARERGLIASDLEITSDDDVYALLFAPGFSTCDSVSAISGRGVGMDVVRHNIENMGGAIEVQSTLGQGSCFTISFPLSSFS